MNINLGVSINEDTFSKLKPSEQRLVLFRTIKRGNQFHNIFHYAWLTLITGYLGLFKTDYLNIILSLI